MGFIWPASLLSLLSLPCARIRARYCSPFNLRTAIPVNSTRPLSNLSLSSPRPLLPPLPPPPPPSPSPPSLLLFLPDSDPLRRYAYDRVSLCKASATGETRTLSLLLLTAGRPRSPDAGWRATQAGEYECKTPPLITVHRQRRRVDTNR